MASRADLPWQVVAGLDVAFLPLACAAMLPPLLATRNWRNIAFPFVLMAGDLANLALHLDAAGIVTTGAGVTRGVLGAMMVILVVMGGRVIPFFTRNRLPGAKAGQSKPLDIAATVALAASGLFEDYISYQRPGERWFAGNAHAAAVLGQRLMIHRDPGHTEDLSLTSHPVRQLGQAIGRVLRPGQRAFGYLTFEVAHLAVDGAVVHSPQPLAHSSSAMPRMRAIVAMRTGTP